MKLLKKKKKKKKKGLSRFELVEERIIKLKDGSTEISQYEREKEKSSECQRSVKAIRDNTDMLNVSRVRKIDRKNI